MSATFANRMTHNCGARQQGLSLIELMVALTIGSILMAGTVFVYVQSRNSYGVNETVARLQETARYALSVIEPEVRMASYWGLVHNPDEVTGYVRPADPASPVAAGAQGCGNNFAVNLYNTVEGADDGYALPCAAGLNGAVIPDADTLTVRRASQTTAVAAAGRIQICSTMGHADLFSDGAFPCPAAPIGRINNLIVNTYYVSADSDERDGLPSLRRQALIAGPAFQDQEIIPGVEDVQIQFGIDPTGVGETATRYIDPDDVIPAEAQVVAVRIWILVRSENPEVGFTDNRVYNYGNRVDYTPADGFRRVLFSRTIQIRNSLG